MLLDRVDQLDTHERTRELAGLMAAGTYRTCWFSLLLSMIQVTRGAGYIYIHARISYSNTTRSRLVLLHGHDFLP